MKQKTGIILYYDYLENEFADLTLEEIGALCVAALAKDQNKEIREDAVKQIEKDRMMKTVYKVIAGKTARATKQWYEWKNRVTKSQKIKEIMQKYNCSEEEAKQIYENYLTEDEKEEIEKPTKKETPKTEEQEYEMEITVEDANGEEFKYTVRLANSNCNFPSEQELQDVIMCFGLTKEYLKEVFDKAQQDKWSVFWTTYFKEDIEEALGIREEF